MICSVLKRATTKYYLIQSFSDVITKYMEDGVITLWIPYGEQPVDFCKAGLEAILDKHFKDNYKIEYE